MHVQKLKKLGMHGKYKNNNQSIGLSCIFFSIIENGEENCRHLIEAHKECMRKAGFNI